MPTHLDPHHRNAPSAASDASPLGVVARSQSEQEAEIKRMRDWTSIWCCSQPLAPRAPGHIWYDMFWDIVPHTNRHNKLVTALWTPTFGP